jgi:mannose-6-phosphate isomerase-like protein (cupin superfamily)
MQSVSTLEIAPFVGPKLVRGGDGEWLSAFGQRVRVIIGAADTDGRLAFVEVEVPPHSGPPYHVHHGEDETFFVRHGRFEFIVDGERHEVEPGDVVYGPRDVPHTFRNLSDETSVLQVVSVCAGFEAFFRECMAVGENAELSTVLTIAAAHNLEFCAPDTPRVGQSKAGARPKIVRKNQAPKVVEAFGDTLQFWVESSDTANASACALAETPSWSGPPLHVHEKEDELFIVESGLYEFRAGDARLQLYPGDALWAPRNVPHSFRVVSDEPGQMIVFAIPGGFDAFFSECAVNFAKGLATPERISEIGAGHGIRFLPPEA